jgi:hypothetical protein
MLRSNPDDANQAKINCMTIELYASSPVENQSEKPEAPISNLNGELPDAEPALDLGDLIGTFDSREEALLFLEKQAEQRNRVVTDSQSAPYNDYTHVEWLTVTISGGEQEDQKENYYLVTDEGY